MATTALTLLFVYNADSGLFNTLTDMAHKAFAPETYSCNLCALTYGTFGIRAEWQQYLESLSYPLQFLHRNELFEQYAVNTVALPAIFVRAGDKLHEVVSAEEINACRDMAELKHKISEGLERSAVRLASE